MASLYSELLPLDKDIANAYQKVTKDTPGGLIDKAGAGIIYQKATVGPVSTQGARLEALFLIWDKASFAADGLKFWEETIVSALLGQGTGKLLKTDAELSDVMNALALASTSVDFVSPKLGIAYNAGQYEAMKQLVKDRKIHIIQADGKGLSKGIAGIYVPEANALFLFPTKKAIGTLVHELTHAIQDWNDLKGLDEYLETDAYIAAGIESRKRKGSFPKESPLFDSVEMVAAGKAKVTNPDWNGTPAKPGAYDKLAAVLAADPDAVKKPGVVRDLSIGETGTAEKQILAEVMKKLAAASKAAPPPAAKPTPAGVSR
ncbi:MAG: hypothetical protein HY040_05995 [Planctomycetes bacterium]|nr:hypothetical protein [Planctomycetota bacterium]